METCPKCLGNSQHAAIICGPGGCRETVLSCDFCGGMGIVAVEAADRWRKGRALRDERVKGGYRRLKEQQLGALRSSSRTRSRTVVRIYPPGYSGEGKIEPRVGH